MQTKFSLYPTDLLKIIDFFLTPLYTSVNDTRRHFMIFTELTKEEFSKFINIYKSNKNVVEKILNKKENIIEVIKYDI